MGTQPPSTPELRDAVSEAVAVEYLKMRQASKEKKPLWLQLFESTGFAALITVLIGGIAGSLISWELQTFAQNREKKSAIIQLNHERQLAAFKEHLDRDRSIIQEMSQTLGEYIDAAYQVAGLSRKEWRNPQTAKQRYKIVDGLTQAAEKWDSNRVRLGILLQLENNDSALQTNWQRITDAASAYAECADRWRTKHSDLTAQEAKVACQSFRDDLDLAVKNFTDRILVLNQFATTSNDAP